MKQAGTLGVAGKRVETVINVWFTATLTAEHDRAKEPPPPRVIGTKEAS